MTRGSIHLVLFTSLILTLCSSAMLVLGRGLRAQAAEIAFLQASTHPAANGVTHGDLLLMDVERRQTHTLVQGMQITGFDWAPDGQQLTFVAWDNTRQLHLYALDLGTGATRRLTDRSAGSEDAPAWSPNGQRLAYLTMGEGTALEVIDFATGQTRRLVTGDFVDTRLAWSPDSQRIAYVTGRLTARNIFVFDFETNTREQITVGEGRISSVVWSPDGTTLLYVLRGVVYGMSPQGGAARTLTPTSSAIMSVTWSPDAAQLYYVGVHDDRMALYTLPVRTADPAQPQTVLPLESLHLPQFSPDGGQIALSVARLHSMDLLLLRADGSAPYHFGAVSYDEWLPAWRPSHLD